uniref:Uncharacterized protein n=1 Tax=Chromera velia CCMP2878 TaxID=1169474 RepID=A0A0G4HTA4_9ALVE|eukprot:Cvel_8419.t1-p1 / transcript=Cvel_8419.t1 / gene=Cvel_8419 / organism=Chromera_velia_CCMP2878 / gene_product=hypothetical protein / transcript_product=hypothetical protein / location=Cvel_scaffold465:13433-13951(-) / protein_length=173 / sequence_SO=supercontig / SO=protein_coding / is_pseudo=false
MCSCATSAACDCREGQCTWPMYCHCDCSDSESWCGCKLFGNAFMPSGSYKHVKNDEAPVGAANKETGDRLMDLPAAGKKGDGKEMPSPSASLVEKEEDACGGCLKRRDEAMRHCQESCFSHKAASDSHWKEGGCLGCAVLMSEGHSMCAEKCQQSKETGGKKDEAREPEAFLA